MSRFENMKTSFQNHVMSSFSSGNIDKLEKVYNSFTLMDLEKRQVIDQILRDNILKLSMKSKEEIQVLESFITHAIKLSRRELCTSSMPVVLLSDIFDVFTLDQCEKLFTYVENNVSVWKEDSFFGACKNNLLRMCNDLLRRLSRSQNTVFRGRILLFLAKFFPFSERSGLNIVSEFNLDSATEYSQDTSHLEKFETNEEPEQETKFKIDYNFYNKFLTLQDFLRNPNQCYNKVRWRVFVNSATDVLTAFQNFKLDAEQIQDRPVQEHLAEATSSTFFAKYMTNPKLLELQLSDADFRRSLLIQFLVILQYLSSPVKFKLDTYELKSEQNDWIKEQVSSVYNLLAETPANSAKFAEAVKHVLTREELWNNWKNEGCPEFKKPASLDENDSSKQKSRPGKRNIGELMKDASERKKYFMGHPELTRLWNLNPNNLEACKVEERNFLPELDDYFKEAIEQMDPAAEIEPKYRKVNDPNFGWRALRLLTQRSSCFFTSTNNPITRLPDYLELSLKRIIKDRPQNSNEEAKQEVFNTESEDIELLKTETQEDGPEEKSERKDAKIPPETLEQVAKFVGEKWRKLAIKVGYEESEVNLIADEQPTDYDRAAKMLKIWAAADDDATVENLHYMLEGLGLMEAANVLQEKNTSE